MPSPLDKIKVKLHVISPSIPRITFEDLATSVTIGELKAKISDTALHPPIGSQRLIYRGRPLVRDEATLQNVFTQPTVRIDHQLIIDLAKAILD